MTGDAVHAHAGPDPESAAREGTRTGHVHAYLIDPGCCASGRLMGDGAGGVIWTDVPRHADVLVVGGPVNSKLAREVRAAYEEMPDPKAVVLLGACALDGGPFARYANVPGGAGDIIPVDVRVPGCPPAPDDIAVALAEASKTATRGGKAHIEARRG